MPEKRKTRDYFSDEKVTIGDLLEKYPAIKENLASNVSLMNTVTRVSDDMYHSLNLGSKSQK